MRNAGQGDDSYPVLPFITTPRTGTPYYDLVLFPVDATSFTLTANPMQAHLKRMMPAAR